MGHILLRLGLLLLQVLSGICIAIPSNNGFIHLNANAPNLIAIYEGQGSIAGTPSIMLPYNLTESVR